MPELYQFVELMPGTLFSDFRLDHGKVLAKKLLLSKKSLTLTIAPMAPLGTCLCFDFSSAFHSAQGCFRLVVSVLQSTANTRADRGFLGAHFT